MKISEIIPKLRVIARLEGLQLNRLRDFYKAYNIYKNLQQDKHLLGSIR